MSKGNVIVAMSGGIDSATAAALLKAQGYAVTGVSMKIWDGSVAIPRAAKHACYGPEEDEDIADARAAADRIGIPFRVFDLARDYHALVLDFVRSEYRQGRTPNPCVRCNVRMKFGLLQDRARQAGLACDYFATGHYARVAQHPRYKRLLLRQAADLDKDQTYFLYGLSRTQLAQCLFPLGEHTKDQVREMSRRFGLDLAHKRESQNFVAGGYRCLFPGPARPGPILDEAGNELGRHTGIHHYTVGQRRGLGALGPDPHYVVAIEPARNAIVVGHKHALYRSRLEATDVVWHVDTPARPLRVNAKLRSTTTPEPATVHADAPNKATVTFTKTQKAITPGQAVVFYADGYLLGGGTIRRAD